MRKVNYRVTFPFGLSETGTILKAYMVAEDEDTGQVILFHPAAKGECASVAICKLDKEGFFVDVSRDSYVNLSKRDETVFRQALI